jgi:cytochrome c peroxidase
MVWINQCNMLLRRNVASIGHQSHGVTWSLAFLGLLSIVFFAFRPVSDNKPNRALIQLGHYFFFDSRLSYNQAKSCASCHEPSLAFTDGYRLSLTSDAAMLQRNSPSLLNLTHRTSFDWANPTITNLRQQMQRPLFSTTPVELGLEGHEAEILERFKKDDSYSALYLKAFRKTIQTLTVDEVIRAIEAYESTLISRKSKYDQYLRQKSKNIFTAQERLGFKLFFSDTLSCATCHGGRDFHQPAQGANFANVGLYNCEGKYPIRDEGLSVYTGKNADNGAFRIPSLRNVALTAPYYHDGSANSLEEVIKNYEQGGRTEVAAGCRQAGIDNPNKDKRLKRFTLSILERKALIAFLDTLTDTSYLKNPHFLDPFNR